VLETDDNRAATIFFDIITVALDFLDAKLYTIYICFLTNSSTCRPTSFLASLPRFSASIFRIPEGI